MPLPEQTHLGALRASGLLHYGRGSLFEEEIALVRRALGVPVALVSLVEEDRQVFAAQHGLPEPWASRGETPLTHSFCRHVVERRAPFAVPDAYDEPLVEHNLAISDLGVRSYLGVPLALPSGEVVGAIAAIGTAPRQWSDNDLALLQSIAAVAAKAIKADLANRRRDALVELGERLRNAASMGEAAFTGSETMARTLGATRAGFGVVDPESDTVDVQPDWTAPGVASVAGRHRFRDFGDFVEDLKRGETVIIPDVRTDARTAPFTEAFAAIDVVDMVNVPIMDRGVFAALMFVHHADLRPLADDDLVFIRTVADRTQAAVARLQAEADQKLMNQELSHRLKNTLALVQAIATQTLRGVADRAPVQALEQRIHALSTAHDQLLLQNAGEAPLGAVIRGAVDALGQDGRVRIGGSYLKLGSRSALSLSLLVHELTTNALKYGALSNDDGVVSVTWETDGDELVLRWSERGGPPVMQPTRKGLGSRLIGQGLIGAGGSAVRYGETGFEAEMRAPLNQLRV